MPAAYNSKTINDNEMNLGGVVKDHLLINLVLFNWCMTSFCHNDIITVKILSFCKKFTNQRRKVYNNILKKLSITKRVFSAKIQCKVLVNVTLARKL